VIPDLQTVAVNGRAVAFREMGDGPTVLLLHGIGSGSASWEGQFDGLGDRLRLIAWDAPGYGGSDPLPDETPAATDYADAAVALLDALDIEAVHLLGHSMGGLIAATVAARYPDRLLSLTLSDPAGGYANAPDEVRVGRMQARIQAIEELGPAGMAERRAPEVLSADAPPAAFDKVRAVMSRLRPAGYAQAARMLHSSDIMDDAQRIAAPAAVMCGGADTVTPEDGCRRIAAAIPGATYRTLEGLGHACYVEDPAVFNDALLDAIGLRA
jgi:pimeloyl-ACP methyl ester carboxylesterase